MSKELWREFPQPLQTATVVAVKKANPDTRVFCHSDGNIAPLIPDLTETGIDILDPLRPECVNPARTIRKIWRSLVILGRGQRTTQDDDGSTR